MNWTCSETSIFCCDLLCNSPLREETPKVRSRGASSADEQPGPASLHVRRRFNAPLLKIIMLALLPVQKEMCLPAAIKNTTKVH